MEELSSRYNPKETEDRWYKSWEENNLFDARPNPAKKPFCIVIPPPNVTGILHMGHAFNNTIQDILIRYHRMKGEESLWMPGTDHAGIATQNVVEKAIAREGLKRNDLGREKFIERVWQWQKQYGSTIIRQLKKLGASCDWPRTRFTMDEEYSQAVIEVFIRLYEKGLIYQGNYIINWCPRCQTALADEEAPHQEINGNLYYIRYPIQESLGHPEEVDGDTRTPGGSRRGHKDTRTQGYVTVATTRPETMLGDTAVAVNPKDKRYKNLVGKTLILPLVNREIKIISDTMVDAEFGTGAVKVTPAHDPNDYLLGKKHNLEFVNVMYPDGRMNDNAGQYKDMDRFSARQLILEHLSQQGLLEKTEPHRLSAGHCYRCHTITEPYLSQQWFVKMKPLAKPAIEAVKKGKIKFYPQRWTKVYLNWMENIQDWCISRQIWWGHRIPVYYCKVCRETGKSKIQNPKSKINSKLQTPNSKLTPGIIVARTKPEKCLDCGSSDIYQDEDVLDTWFSSWLWPFATFYWPRLGRSSELGVRSKKLPTPNSQLPTDLDYFYPTSVLVTAPEIIFFWVARMIMAGLEFMKDIPFKDVYIHGTVRDTEGKKMSKSLGNIIDPLEIIDEYGSDALRFSLISITSQGQDVFLSKERFEQGRNFANKIWNASRFIIMNLEQTRIKTDLCEFFSRTHSLSQAGSRPISDSLAGKKESLDIVNRWILSRFYSVLKAVNNSLDTYHFNEAANLLYSFFWHEFCDWYLEIIKPDIKNPKNQIVMYKVLEKSLRLLHPFMPFITEEIWQRIQDTRTQGHPFDFAQGRPFDFAQGRQDTSIMIQSWPHVQGQMIDKKSESQMQALFKIVEVIRNLRAELEIKPEQKVTVSIYPHKDRAKRLIEEQSHLIVNLSRLEKLNLLQSNRRPKAATSNVTEDTDIYLHFTGIVDIGKEQHKLKEKLLEEVNRCEAKKKLLANPEFVKKADSEVVENVKNEIIELENKINRLRQLLNELL